MFFIHSVSASISSRVSSVSIVYIFFQKACKHFELTHHQLFYTNYALFLSLCSQSSRVKCFHKMPLKRPKQRNRMPNSLDCLVWRGALVAILVIHYFRPTVKTGFEKWMRKGGKGKVRESSFVSYGTSGRFTSEKVVEPTMTRPKVYCQNAAQIFLERVYYFKINLLAFDPPKSSFSSFSSLKLKRSDFLFTVCGVLSWPPASANRWRRSFSFPFFELLLIPHHTTPQHHTTDWATDRHNLWERPSE